MISALLIAACGDADQRDRAETALLARMIAAEDARPHAADSLALLYEGLAADVEGRRFAVRGLGRLERDTLVPRIAPLLADSNAAVRAEAANALAQAVSRGGMPSARAPLLDRLAIETDPAVRGALAEAIGRLRHASEADAAEVATALLAITDEVAQPGLVRGLYFLARQPFGRRALPAGAAERLRRLMTTRPGADGAATVDAHTRALATATLVATGTARAEDLEAVMFDADPFVRREAAAGIVSVRDTTGVRRLTLAALADDSPVVRYDALRAWGRLFQREVGCHPVVESLRDADADVRLLAIDLLAADCPDDAPVAAMLDSLSRTLPADTTSDAAWHAAAHAMVSLAARDSARALGRLPQFVEHGNVFVRMYAARAAALLPDVPSLSRLAGDVHPNVRADAVRGLAAAVGHDADSVYLAQLDEGDSQLLQAAAAALAGTPLRRAVHPLLDALDRVSATRHETARDARMALLERVRELGIADDAVRLEPYLTDFDPAFAAEVAVVLNAWTGETHAPRPVLLPGQPPPSPARLDSLSRARFRFEMAEGGSFEVRLHAWDAPTNAARFASLVQQRWFDGLSFHRLVPNFVLQGGSPYANEYAGDGPFTRDEIGISNLRGTVGLSTRGRDTGDGQIYVNLIDNVRLDHDYTVFGEITEGMDVVDRLLEGARIARVTMR